MTNVFEEFKAGLADAGVTEDLIQSTDADIIGKLGEVIEEKFTLENKIAELKEELENNEKLLKEYDQVKIPQLVEAAGLSEVTTKNGFKITIKTEYRGSISEANSNLALDWFIKSGGADTIKNNYVVPVSIADKEIAESLEAILGKVGLDYSRKLGIAWNTLAGVIKELATTGRLEYNDQFEALKKEKNLPADLTLSQVLGVYKYKTTKVQKPRKK